LCGRERERRCVVKDRTGCQCPFVFEGGLAEEDGSSLLYTEYWYGYGYGVFSILFWGGKWDEVSDLGDASLSLELARALREEAVLVIFRFFPGLLQVLLQVL
jgi:hypothetical protein